MTGTSGTNAFVRAGTKPITIFAPVVAIAGVGFLIVAAFFLAHSGAGFVVDVRGPVSTSVAIPDGAPQHVVIYGSTTGPDPGDSAKCTLQTATRGFVGMTFGAPRVIDGQTFYQLGKTTQWQKGATVTCKGGGVQELLLGHDAGRTALLKALLCGFVGVGATSMGLVGLGLRRRARR